MNGQVENRMPPPGPPAGLTSITAAWCDVLARS